MGYHGNCTRSELQSRLQQIRLDFVNHRFIMVCLSCCSDTVCVYVWAKQHVLKMHALCLHTHPHMLNHVSMVLLHFKLLLNCVLIVRCDMNTLTHTQKWADTYASPAQTDIPPWCAGWHSCVHVDSPSSSSSGFPPPTACSQSGSSSVNTSTVELTPWAFHWMLHFLKRGSWMFFFITHNYKVKAITVAAFH